MLRHCLLLDNILLLNRNHLLLILNGSTKLRINLSWSRHARRMLVVSLHLRASSLSLELLSILSLLVIVASHLLDKQLNDLDHLRVLQELWVYLSRLRFLKLLEICPVSCFFLLELSIFLEFIMGDIELLSIEGVRVKLLSSKSCLIRRFEAYKSIESFSFFREDFDTLDFSKLREKLFKIFWRSIWREILDIEVASLLWVLESQLFFAYLLFSVRFLKGFSDINLLTFMFLSILLFDSFSSWGWSHFIVSGIIETNEGKFRFRRLLIFLCRHHL